MPVPLSWPLLPDPSAVLPSAPGAGTASSSATAERGQLAFLGSGVLRPFQRDQKNDFAHGGGRALLSSRIGQILGTKADSTAGPGELPWRTNFGSRLHLLRHRNNALALAELARVMILEALGTWERNITVTSVTPVETGNPRKLLLDVRYKLVDQSGATLVEDVASVPLR
jgi:phage baseplate assembly protein W